MTTWSKTLILIWLNIFIISSELPGRLMFPVVELLETNTSTYYSKLKLSSYFNKN